MNSNCNKPSIHYQAQENCSKAQYSDGEPKNLHGEQYSNCVKHEENEMLKKCGTNGGKRNSMKKRKSVKKPKNKRKRNARKSIKSMFSKMFK